MHKLDKEKFIKWILGMLNDTCNSVCLALPLSGNLSNDIRIISMDSQIKCMESIIKGIDSGDFDVD